MKKTSEDKLIFSKKIKYGYYCFVIGDIVGFGNGLTEFNQGERKITSEMTNTLIYDFIFKGGYTNFDYEKNYFSDDTLMSDAVIHALSLNKDVLNRDNDDSIFDLIVSNFLSLLDDVNFKKFAYGTTVINSLTMIKRGVNWRSLPYNSEHRGNGAAMRAFCIGMAFSHDDYIKALLIYSIEVALMTHNSATGILSSITIAYLVKLSMNDIDIMEWPYSLIDLLTSSGSEFIDSYIQNKRPNIFMDFSKDKHTFLDAWNNYFNLRFDSKGFKDIPVLRNPRERLEWFYSNFNPNRFKPKSKNESYLQNTGSTGEDSCIFAYDCVATCIKYCNSSHESLIYLSACHAGDSDTIGAMAGVLYGIYTSNKQNDMIDSIIKKINGLTIKEIDVFIDKYYVCSLPKTQSKTLLKKK